MASDQMETLSPEPLISHKSTRIRSILHPKAGMTSHHAFSVRAQPTMRLAIANAGQDNDPGSHGQPPV